MSDTEQLDFYVGNWLVEPALCRISMEGRESHLQARWTAVLVYLAQNSDRVVSTNEIMDRVWGNIHVTLDSLYLNISYLRKALAEDPNCDEYIETIPKRGYRLVVPVVFPEIEKAASTSKNKKRALIAAFVALALATIMYLPRTNEQDVPIVALIPNSIAVLPFVNLESGENSDLSELFADVLMNQLTKIEGMAVMARTSSFSMNERNATAQEIGQRLGVSTILEGSIRRDDQTIHVTAQLINTSSGFHLWSDTIDRDIDAFWEIHTEIARKIAETMSLDMPPAYLAVLDPMDRPIVRRTRVNSFTSNNQDQPEIVALENGGYVIGWHSKEQDGSNWGVYAQLFDQEHEPMGEEIRLHISNFESQYDLAFVSRKDGGFTAIWNSWLHDGSG
jgi:TolB-like protein/DNA-binding winged helix-turn-helix (wHTH) protein